MDAARGPEGDPRRRPRGPSWTRSFAAAEPGADRSSTTRATSGSRSSRAARMDRFDPATDQLSDLSRESSIRSTSTSSRGKPLRHLLAGRVRRVGPRPERWGVPIQGHVDAADPRPSARPRRPSTVQVLHSVVTPTSFNSPETPIAAANISVVVGGAVGSLGINLTDLDPHLRRRPSTAGTSGSASTDSWCGWSPRRSAAPPISPFRSPCRWPERRIPRSGSTSPSPTRERLRSSETRSISSPRAPRPSRRPSRSRPARRRS